MDKKQVAAKFSVCKWDSIVYAAKVVHAKGKLIHDMGFHLNGEKYVRSEELLFLIENKFSIVLDVNDSPMPLNAIVELLLMDNSITPLLPVTPLEFYEVFKSLKSQGYNLYRHPSFPVQLDRNLHIVFFAFLANKHFRSSDPGPPDAVVAVSS